MGRRTGRASGRPATRDLEEGRAQGALLRAQRKATGLRAVAVADRLGVPIGRYRSWERSFGDKPRQQYGEALKRILVVAVPAGETKTTSDAQQTDLAARTRRGERLRERRQWFGLSQTCLAQAAGINPATLRNWEAMLPLKVNDKVAQALEDILKVPRGWLLDETMKLPPSEAEAGAIDADTVAGEIRAISANLTHWRGQWGRATMKIEDLSESDRKLANYFAERYGVLGEDLCTLQSVGNRYGLTRERIRQVQEKMLARVTGRTFRTPRLDELAKRIEAVVPITVEEFDRKNRDLLGESLSVEGATRFAREVLGRRIAKIDVPHGPAAQSVQRMLVEEYGATPVAAIRTAVRKMISNCGAAHVMFVAGAAGDIHGGGITPTEVRKIVQALRGFEWLMEGDGWFWLGPDQHNRALITTRKVLAVAGKKVDIESLHQAFCRSRRLTYDEDRDNYPIELPWQVMREVLARSPDLKTIQKNDFELSAALDPRDVLNESERAIYDIADRHGGIVSRRTLDEGTVKAGLFSVMNLQLMLQASPIFERVEWGVFKLRGRDLDLQALAAARSQVGSQNRLHQAAQMRNEGGTYRVEVSITDNMMLTYSIRVPTAIADAIPGGEYQVTGTVIGKASFGGTPKTRHVLYGLMALLRREGVEAGWNIDLLFDPVRKAIVVERCKEGSEQ